MAKIPGTAVASPLVPIDSSSTTPTHSARYGKGGLRGVATIAALDDIPTTYREHGMLVFVETLGAYYQCGPGPVFSFGAAPFVPGPSADTIYPNTSSGLAAVGEGEYFYVATSEGLKLYRDVAGAAAFVGDFPSLATLSAEVAAAAASVVAAGEAQGLAEDARDEATEQAGIATTQAGIATNQAGIATTQAGESANQAGIASGHATQSGIFRDQARAAADATAPQRFFDTYADALAAINTIPDDAVVEVFEDENQDGYRTRYLKEPGNLVLKVRFEADTIRTDLGSGDPGKGAQLVANSIVKRDTIAQMQSMIGLVPGQRISVGGYSDVGDFGGGEFYYDASSTATVDGVLVFPATGMGGGGRLIRILSGLLSTAMFGARGDGVTNDAAPLQSALNYIAQTGQTLDFLDRNYLTNQALTLQNGQFYKLHGSKATVTTTAAALFVNQGASFHASGIKFTGPTGFIDYSNAPSQVEVEFEISGCGVTGFGGTAVRCVGSQTHLNKFTKFVINKCTFDGNRYDLFINAYALENVFVQKNLFINGGPESLNFQGNVDRGTRYLFDGNIFFNYLNNLGGSDADGHFIRCYGLRAVISNNIFDTLNVAVGTLGGDTEALRPLCNEVIISNNLFRNAGMAEAVVALKGCRDSLVIGNQFRCTDEYNAESIARGFYTVAVLTDANTKIIGNVFDNFNGAVVDTQDGDTDAGTITIENNILIDCLCTNYSGSQVFRLTSINTRFVVRGNVIKSREAVDKFPKNIFRLVGGTREYIIENNVFRCTNNIYDNAANAIVYAKGNNYEQCQRIIGVGTLLKFFSINDTFIHDAGPSFTNMFGSNSVGVRDFLVQDMTIDWGAPADQRYLGIQPIQDCVGLAAGDFQFRDSAGTAVATHKFQVYFRRSSGTTTIDSTFENNFQAIGTPTLTVLAPFISSNFLAFRRPNGATAGTSVQGTFSLKAKGVV